MKISTDPQVQKLVHMLHFLESPEEYITLNKRITILDNCGNFTNVDNQFKVPDDEILCAFKKLLSGLCHYRLIREGMGFPSFPHLAHLLCRFHQLDPDNVF